MFLLARTDMSPAEPERTVDKWIETYQRATAEAAQQTRQVADATAEQSRRVRGSLRSYSVPLQRGAVG